MRRFPKRALKDPPTTTFFGYGLPTTRIPPRHQGTCSLSLSGSVLHGVCLAATGRPAGLQRQREAPAPPSRAFPTSWEEARDSVASETPSRPSPRPTASPDTQPSPREKRRLRRRSRRSTSTARGGLRLHHSAALGLLPGRVQDLPFRRRHATVASASHKNSPSSPRYVLPLSLDPFHFGCVWQQLEGRRLCGGGGVRHRKLVQPQEDDDVQVADNPGADGRHGSARLREVQGHRQEDECRLPAGGATEPPSMPQEIAEGRQRAEGDGEEEKTRQSRTSSCQEAETQATEEVCQEVPIVSARDPSPHSVRRTEDAVSGVESESSCDAGRIWSGCRQSDVRLF